MSKQGFINKVKKPFLVFGFLFAFLLFSFPQKTFADNLLQNSSFEDSSSGAPNLWTKNVSTATLTISTTANSGTSSASINKTNGATGLIYLYQDVDVDVSAFYSLSGYVVKNDSRFSWVILRISWRTSSSEISKTDSSQLGGDSSAFQKLQIDSVQPPVNAVKARIELAANIQTANPSNPALFDDINFSQVEAPSQPTATPKPTPTPTPSPTPTPTPAPVSTTLSMDLRNFATEESVLGSEAGIEETTKPKVDNKVRVSAEKENILPKVFIIFGFLTIIISSGIYFKDKWRKLLKREV